uniref:Lactate permease n=1 Tax=Tetradesmus obliquus TaxID=3088 RepID=A0A383VQV1_TETOB
MALNASAAAALPLLQPATAAAAPQLPLQLTEAGAALQHAVPETGLWGPAAAVLLCMLPLAFLLAVTLIRRISMPCSTSLPVAAVLLALIRLTYLASAPVTVLGSCVRGLLEGLTPLSVIFGAIVLFEAMQHSRCLPWMMHEVKCLSAGQTLAEVFLIGWAFAFMISGVGGFNTPIALGAPMLASLGHDPLTSLLVVVVFNTLASHMGSMGMAVWFGFKILDLGPANILLIGLKSTIIVGAISLVVAPIAASFLVPWRELLRSSLFVVLSVLSAAVPTAVAAIFSAEFPVLIGGVTSLIGTTLLVYYKVGLKPSHLAAAAAADAFTLPGGLEGAPSLKFTPELLPAASELHGVKYPGGASAWRRRIRKLFAKQHAVSRAKHHGNGESAAGVADQGRKPRGTLELAEFGAAGAFPAAVVAEGAATDAAAVSHDQESEQEQEQEQEHLPMLRHLLSSFVQHGSSSAGNHRQQQQQQQQRDPGAGRLRGWLAGFRRQEADVELPSGTLAIQQQQQQHVAADASIKANTNDPSRSSAADGSSTHSGSSGSGNSSDNQGSDEASRSSSTEASDVPVFQQHQQQQHQQQQQQQQFGAGLQRAHSTRSLPGPDELRSLSTVSAPASYWNMRNMLPVTNNVTNISFNYVSNMLHDMAECEELWEDAHSLAALPMLPASLVGATIHHAGITGVSSGAQRGIGVPPASLTGMPAATLQQLLQHNQQLQQQLAQLQQQQHQLHLHQQQQQQQQRHRRITIADIESAYEGPPCPECPEGPEAQPDLRQAQPPQGQAVRTSASVRTPLRPDSQAGSQAGHQAQMPQAVRTPYWTPFRTGPDSSIQPDLQSQAVRTSSVRPLRPESQAVAGPVRTLVRTTSAGLRQWPPVMTLVRTTSAGMQLEQRALGVLEGVCRTLPVWLTVLLLLLTRVQQFKVQAAFQSTEPSFSLQLGTLGTFKLSASLVLQLQQIFLLPGVSWKYETLYVPCLLPFVVAGLVTVALYRDEMRQQQLPFYVIFTHSWRKMKGTFPALLGAMILSELISAGGAASPAFIIGFYLSKWMGRGYLAASGFIGAIGSFISGSVMAGNMTFGAIQKVAAERIGVPVTSMLAVQVAGSCAGKMMCMSNILSAKVLMNLGQVREGKVVRRTAPIALLFVLLSQALGLIFTLGGVWPDKPLPSSS